MMMILGGEGRLGYGLRGLFRCKNLWISMMTPIVFLFTLGKPFMSIYHT